MSHNHGHDSDASIERSDLDNSESEFGIDREVEVDIGGHMNAPDSPRGKVFNCDPQGPNQYGATGVYIACFRAWQLNLGLEYSEA